MDLLVIAVHSPVIMKKMINTNIFSEHCAICGSATLKQKN